MRKMILALLLISLSNCTSTETIQSRTVEEYLAEYKRLVNTTLENKNALTDSLTLKSEYFDQLNGKKRINRKGIELYVDAQSEAHEKMFQNWNYINHLRHKEYVYAIYFTIMGMDDLSWQVIRFKEDHWHSQTELALENISPLSDYLEFDQSEFDRKGYNTIIYNYDEGEANIENVRLFIKNDYLVFERGNLMHSLYDMDTEELLYNEISPWYIAKQNTDSEKMSKEILNDWITNNLHNRIAKRIE